MGRGSKVYGRLEALDHQRTKQQKQNEWANGKGSDLTRNQKGEIWGDRGKGN